MESTVMHVVRFLYVLQTCCTFETISQIPISINVGSVTHMTYFMK